MQPSKSKFFIIIILAAIIVAIMIAASFLVTSGSLGDITSLQPTVEIAVVVAPSIKPWVDQAAEAFNRANATNRVNIIAATDLIPRNQFRINASQQAVPVAWIAEASFVVEMAQSDGGQVEDGQSVATTSLAWGGYQDKLEQFEQNYGELNWQAIHAKATSSDSLKLVIASPQNSAEGIAALGSAAAAHLNTQTVSSGDIGTADTWLTETLGDRKAYSPPTPGQSFASVQGRTLGDLGLLSMATWRKAKLDQAADFLLTSVEPDVPLDYPFAIWTTDQTSSDREGVATDFRDFLLEDAQQARLADFFFDPSNTGQTGLQLDGAAAVRLQNWANRVLQ